MKNRSLSIALAAMAILVLLLSACAPAATEPATTQAPAETEAVAETEPVAEGGARTYVLVPKNLGNPYFDTGNAGAQEAAGELGVTVLYQGSATADATEQITLINSLSAQNVDGLAISANDADALAPTGQAAMEAGIPVVSWDSAIAPEGRVLHINQAEAAGIAQGNEFRVNSHTLGTQRGAAVAIAPDGDCVVAWVSSGQDA